MEKLITKKLIASEAEIKLAMPFVQGLAEGKLSSPLDFKVALENFLNKEVNIELILGLKQFNCYIEEEDKRLTLNNVL